MSQNDIRQILNLQINDLQRRLDEQSIKLKVAATAKALLMEKGYDLEQGARPMRRAVQDLIEDPLATGLLDGRIADGDIVSVGRKGDELQLASKHPEPKSLIDEAETAAAKD